MIGIEQNISNTSTRESIEPYLDGIGDDIADLSCYYAQSYRRGLTLIAAAKARTTHYSSATQPFIPTHVLPNFFNFNPLSLFPHFYLPNTIRICSPEHSGGV